MRFSRLSDWLAWQERLHPRPIDLGLERLRRTLARLGWRRPSCPVITVGGTNGKGSTVALLSRILTEAGYRVGAFTSPHLVRYNERIRIAEREISDASLMAAFERIDAARGDDTLTFFEFNALAALLTFETANVDAIVLEVGLGGRLDAVNVVDADVAIVSSIALDHCDWLGHDLEAIGAEKAGIFRPNRPAIFGARTIPQSVVAHARAIGAQLQQLGRDFDWRRDDGAWTWTSGAQRFDSLPLPALTGEVQFDNAATVLAALTALSARLPAPVDAIRRGLASVALAGRFQVVDREAQWILDVGHNPAAARTLSQSLRSVQRGAPTLAVFAALADKDVAGVIAEMAGCFDGWIVAQLEGPRALSVAELEERLGAAGEKVVASCASIAEACAVAEASAGSGRIVVFGSFHTVGPALEWLGHRGATLA
jgi:dihydrofolate synthase/folylpolyglutamate synthase